MSLEIETPTPAREDALSIAGDGAEPGGARANERAAPAKTVYPFGAIVGQEAMKSALTIAAIDPSIGGVLIMGDRGAGKSTAVRGLAQVLPDIAVVEGCPFRCDPKKRAMQCASCASAETLVATKMRAPVVDLPLGATEDRVVGALDLERALASGEKRFEPGLLAAANRGFLYIDEVNLLEDHLVDLLLDVAASGENVVEREGLSVRHPSRFVLVGSGNPEEGELRPQLLDRFGLCVSVATPPDVETRVEIVKRRDAFDRDPRAFARRFAKEERAIGKAITRARRSLARVEVGDAILRSAAALCQALGADGLRGELTLMRAARARAALDGASETTVEHLRAVAPACLEHRLRRDPLDEVGGPARIERAIAETLGA